MFLTLSFDNILWGGLMDIYTKLKKAGIRFNDDEKIHIDDIGKLEIILKGNTVLGHPLLISGNEFPLKKVLGRCNHD